MIVKDEIYTIKCDDCGEFLENTDYGCSFACSDIKGVRDEAQDAEWVVDVDGKDYCPNCAHKRGLEIIEED